MTGKVTVTRQALILNGEVGKEEVVSALEDYLKYEHEWFIGDLVVFYQTNWGDTLFNELRLDNVSAARKSECKKVATAYPPPARREELRWAHHKASLKIENNKKRKQWMDQCIEEGWRVGQFSRRIGKHLREAEESLNGKQRGEPEAFGDIENLPSGKPEPADDAVATKSRVKAGEALKMLRRNIGNLPGYEGQWEECFKAMGSFIG